MLGDQAVLPENPASYLTDWLFDIGPSGPGGDTLGWLDIAAWQEISGVDLEPWEGRLIRRLSGEYGSMKYKAEKADCPAPYTADLPVHEVRSRVDDQFRAMLAGMRG